MPVRPSLILFALATATLCATTVQAQPAPVAAAIQADGVLKLRSRHDFATTVTRLKAAIAAKGVRFFDAIDQQALATEAGLVTGRSVIVRFGNPPLGVQFLQANRYAGLDWPVRMLVVEEADGSVWLAWTDFGFIARRYGIESLTAQVRMATEVSGAIAADAAN